MSPCSELARPAVARGRSAVFEVKSHPRLEAVGNRARIDNPVIERFRVIVAPVLRQRRHRSSGWSDLPDAYQCYETELAAPRSLDSTVGNDSGKFQERKALAAAGGEPDSDILEGMTPNRAILGACRESYAVIVGTLAASNVRTHPSASIGGALAKPALGTFSVPALLAR